MRMSIRASAGLGAGLLFFLPASAAIIPLVPPPARTDIFVDCGGQIFY
jgi:hypothetical protein